MSTKRQGWAERKTERSNTEHEKKGKEAEASRHLSNFAFMQRYKHLNAAQRYTIEAMRRQKKTQKEIADTIGVSPSTVSRELKRNSGKRGYRCGQANGMALDRMRRLQNYRALTAELRGFIREKLTREQWSPAQIAGYLRRRGAACACVETIYAYIRRDRENGGDLYLHCRHRLKRRKKTPAAKAGAVRGRTMIDDMPREWDGSEPARDFEMDTIVGKDGKGAIVTIVDRCTNFLMARKLPLGKNADALARAVCAMMLPYKGKARSIVTDNGSEFASHKAISGKLGVRIFFAHPYSAWEKGCVEYHNKLIRQYIPKGTDFNDVSDQFLKRVVEKINRRPREKLAFAAPVVEFFNSLN